MIDTHKLHCYQLVQLVWSIFTTQAGVNYKSRMCERVCVFCGIGKSLICQNKPSCGKALLLVYQSSRGKTAVCQMRDFHCGLTGNIGALGQSYKRQRDAAFWETKQKHVLRVKGHSLRQHGRNTCRFYRNIWRRWSGEVNKAFLQSGRCWFNLTQSSRHPFIKIKDQVSVFTGCLTSLSSSTQERLTLLTPPKWPTA